MTAPSGTSLCWRPFRLPLRHRFEAAHGALADREGVVLVLEDADGRRGLGEASPLPTFGGGTVADVLALLEVHGAALAGGADPAALEVTPSPGGATALRCAIDVARLDLEAQRAGVPVVQLFSADPARAVSVNAVIGQGSPDDVATYAREAVAAGYGVLKVKVGAADLDHDVAVVAAVRAACPDARIRLDANGAWDLATAERALTRLAPHGIELIEQPTPPAEVRALTRLRSLALIPIAADEALQHPGVDAVLDVHGADFLVLKPMVLGGLRRAYAIAQQGLARGARPVVTTTFDSSIGTAAALHLAAALPTWNMAHGLSTGAHLAADIVREPLLPQRGMLRIPDAPGLGVTLDDAALEVLATGPWRAAPPVP